AAESSLRHQAGVRGRVGQVDGRHRRSLQIMCVRRVVTRLQNVMSERIDVPFVRSRQGSRGGRMLTDVSDDGPGQIIRLISPGKTGTGQGTEEKGCGKRKAASHS